ncbi:glucosamine-6-phosphate deaminase [Streptococcus suis]|uniref:Glucosamine-6-phosphate deaminase n=1 Tax=Streptococcus suis TaxID=1307 RepID=A0A116RAV3_STRSU|nr:glucosamine-6-phosphate deaminase [Streptococcus suis]NQR96415.1 glucosamine-6-phosphate deaminase [Streptococcus suis]CYX57767.1 6-phosphogluconolactonase/glucosamine-6-phosphateisomerase/deaminase [Streptococcus suis]
MKIHVVNNQVEGATVALDILREKLNGGAKVLGLATGSSPLEFYRLIRESDLDFSDATSVNLDEYVGLGEESDQSYIHFMKENLFNDKPFKKSYLPDGLATDVVAETERYNKILAEHPVDFQILGIGRNGHIGFNEPGAPFDGQTHRVELAPSTIEANARFFENLEDVPKQAISMGIANIMAAKTIVLMAYGQEKADAIKATVEGAVTEDVPASVLQNHDNVILILDQAAASKLKK